MRRIIQRTVTTVSISSLTMTFVEEATSSRTVPAEPTLDLVPLPGPIAQPDDEGQPPIQT